MTNDNLEDADADAEGGGLVAKVAAAAVSGSISTASC